MITIAKDKIPLRKRKVGKFPLPVFVLILVAMIAATAVAAAILLGPISAPAATTVKKIEMAINGISSDLVWGSQYLNNDFNVSVITNTYSNQRSGVVAILVIPEFTCAQLTSQGFSLKPSTDGVTYGTAIVGVDATGISKGPSNYVSGCAFIPDAGTYGLTIPAGEISTVSLPWSHVLFFRFTFGSGDVSGNTYTFSAQPYAP